MRGQVSFADLPQSPVPAAWGGYAIPTRNGILFGATHDRDDTGVDIRAEDHLRNLALLAQRRPILAAALAETPLAGRASLRAATPDHLPLAGPAPGAPPGSMSLAAWAGGASPWRPCSARHLAAAVLGAPSPLPRSLARTVRC